jgi:hypothetical protein
MVRKEAMSVFLLAAALLLAGAPEPEATAYSGDRDRQFRAS